MKQLFTPLILLALAGPLALGQTSETNSRLKKALERFPAADQNKDGVLTAGEARAYQEAHAPDRRSQPRPAEVPAGGKSHIYKEIGEVKLPLYVYTPEGHVPDSKAPAIVFFFGGGWRSGSPTQFVPHCEALSQRGMVAITVEYRVSSRHPGVKVEDCIEDAKSAMRWVRSHAKKLGIDPHRIASGGGSAGGHLAACVALCDEFNAATDDLKVSARPDAMILFNPAMGMWATQEDESNGRSHGPLEKVTPLTYASSPQPPCIMFFGDQDTLLRGAEAFRKESVKSGNACRIVTYAGQGHGFFNAGRSGNVYFQQTLAETDRFLVELGWLAAEKPSASPTVP